MDFLDEAQQGELLGRLLAMTQSDRLVWQRLSEGSDYAFGAHSKSGKYAYVVSSRDADDLAPYELDIYTGGPDPKHLQSIETREWAQTNIPLADLYGIVKRRVLNIDGIGQEILDDLADGD
jgi:hypothetical protein